MSADVYISVPADFRDHPKMRKFARLLGSPLGFAHLIALWSWAAKAAPDGDLSEIDIEEIEDGCDYTALDGKCYRALVTAGFIDETPEGGRQIHNWMAPGRTGYAIAKAEEDRERWRKNQGLRRGGGRPARTAEAGQCPRDVSETSPRHSETSPGVPVESTESPTPSRFTVHGSQEIQIPPSRAIPGAGATEHEAPVGTVPIDAYSLIHCMKVRIARTHPMLGITWNGGPFAAKDADALLEGMPVDIGQRVGAGKQLLSRIDAWLASGATDLTVKGLHRWLNTLPDGARGSPKARNPRVGRAEAPENFEYPDGEQAL